MNKSSMCYGFIIMVLVCSLYACSQSSNPEADRGALEDLTHQTAEDAMDAIQKPLDKARSVQERAKSRTKSMEQVEE